MSSNRRSVDGRGAVVCDPAPRRGWRSFTSGRTSAVVTKDESASHGATSMVQRRRWLHHSQLRRWAAKCGAGALSGLSGAHTGPRCLHRSSTHAKTNSFRAESQRRDVQLARPRSALGAVGRAHVLVDLPAAGMTSTKTSHGVMTVALANLNAPWVETMSACAKMERDRANHCGWLEPPREEHPRISQTERQPPLPTRTCNGRAPILTASNAAANMMPEQVRVGDLEESRHGRSPLSAPGVAAAAKRTWARRGQTARPNPSLASRPRGRAADGSSPSTTTSTTSRGLTGPLWRRSTSGTPTPSTTAADSPSERTAVRNPDSAPAACPCRRPLNCPGSTNPDQTYRAPDHQSVSRCSTCAVTTTGQC